MSIDDVNWWDKAVDWSWTLLLAAGAAAVGRFLRVSRHEARIVALEGQDAERRAKLIEIEGKIDEHHQQQIERIDALGRELRDDLRMIVSKMIDKVPRA